VVRAWSSPSIILRSRVKDSEEALLVEPNIGPRSFKPSPTAADGSYSHVTFPRLFNRWEINTPEVPFSIAIQRLKDETRRYAVSHPGLNNPPGLQMAGQTPYRSHQSSVTIIPRPKALRANPNTLSFQFTDYLGP
jgi:hypothetical protein